MGLSFPNLLVLLAILVTLSLAHPSGIDRLTTLPPIDVTIDSIVYGGTGCPQGSAAVKLAADNKSFSARFKNFTAKLGTDRITDTRKFCQLNLALTAPAGWQYTVVAANFTGYANLGPDTKAVHTSTLYFSGSTEQSIFAAPLSGPTKYVYNIQTADIIGGNILSPCNSDAALNIKSELTLSGTGSGEITEAGESGKLVRIFELAWSKC
ncbi:hypothetical protein ABW20_dc0100501 [Dactylellina cionopaga]|nr:hypothetical protein ABW20_dc0100501 [Dactylellina cionopaga]